MEQKMMKNQIYLGHVGGILSTDYYYYINKTLNT